MKGQFPVIEILNTIYLTGKFLNKLLKKRKTTPLNIYTHDFDLIDSSRPGWSVSQLANRSG